MSQVKMNEMNECLQHSPGSFLHSTCFHQIRDYCTVHLLGPCDHCAGITMFRANLPWQYIALPPELSRWRRAFRGLVWIHCTRAPLIFYVDMYCIQHAFSMHSACIQCLTFQCTWKTRSFQLLAQCPRKWSKLCCIWLHMVVVLLTRNTEQI